MLGKAGSGKTKTIALLSERIQPQLPAYTETIGIHVKDIYWPAKVYGKIYLFKFQFWQSGESCSKRFNYISTVIFLYDLYIITHIEFQRIYLTHYIEHL